MKMQFPHFKQLDSMDCGPSCLRMIAKFYGKNYSLQALRSRAFITKSGVSILGISDAAESIGFRTRGYRLTWEQLRATVPKSNIELPIVRGRKSWLLKELSYESIIPSILLS